MSRVAVVGNREFCVGFDLIGVRDLKITPTQKDFEKNIVEIMEDENIGIVVVQQEFLNNASWKIKKYLKEKSFPVVVSFPLKGEEGEEENIDELIKRALGFDLK